MNAPAAWSRLPLTACERCSNRVGPIDAMQCSHPMVAGAQRTVSCEAARARNGGCGPDANHLHWPAIEVQPMRRAA